MHSYFSNRCVLLQLKSVDVMVEIIDIIGPHICTTKLTTDLPVPKIIVKRTFIHRTFIFELRKEIWFLRCLN